MKVVRFISSPSGRGNMERCIRRKMGEKGEMTIDICKMLEEEPSQD